MNAAIPTCRIAAARFDGGFGLIGGAVSATEKGLCQERKSDFIPLDNIYTYPLYSEGFSVCGHARPSGMGGAL